MEKKNVKIVFFDIDGTLIDMDYKVISKKTVEALNRLHENGIKVCIATGRSPITLPNLYNAEVDAYVTYNGAYCFDKEKTIFSCCLTQKDVQQIVCNATLMHRPVAISTKDTLITNGIDKDLKDYFLIANEIPIVRDDFNEVCKEEIYQMMAGARKEEYSSLMENVENAKIAAWWDRAVDIIPKKSGKGIGIEKVLEHYHIGKENAIAFGDGNNDIEMFQAVSIGVAMQNASKELKQVSKDICKSVKEDGIYEYVKEHHLI